MECYLYSALSSYSLRRENILCKTEHRWTWNFCIWLFWHLKLSCINHYFLVKSTATSLKATCNLPDSPACIMMSMLNSLFHIFRFLSYYIIKSKPLSHILIIFKFQDKITTIQWRKYTTQYRNLSYFDRIILAPMSNSELNNK